MLVDESGNPLVPSEPPADAAPVFDTSDAPANDDAPAPAPAAPNPLEPVMTAMGEFSQAIQEDDSPETRKKVHAALAKALDAFTVMAAHKARRGVDYDINIRSVPNGPPQVSLQDHTARGRDFSANWARFMQDMERSAAAAQDEAFRGAVVQKITAMEHVLNSILVDVAALKAKVR